MYIWCSFFSFTFFNLFFNYLLVLFFFLLLCVFFVGFIDIEARHKWNERMKMHYCCGFFVVLICGCENVFVDNVVSWISRQNWVTWANKHTFNLLDMWANLEERKKKWIMTNITIYKHQFITYQCETWSPMLFLIYQLTSSKCLDWWNGKSKLTFWEATFLLMQWSSLKLHAATSTPEKQIHT